nr:hypothetical protein [Tanacetum cinerariifolium]
MMKGSDIGEQAKKAKLFNEWEKFTSTDRESIESYYHRFMKLMNDLKRNKHFPENIASDLKFLNNLQPEWRHVTIVRQTKNLHEADFTQIYDFLKMNQGENFIQPPTTSLEDINDPTEAMNATLILFAKAFQLSAPTNNNQRTSSNPRNRHIAQPVMNIVAQNQQGFNAWQNGGIQGAQNAGVQSGENQNGLVVVPGIANKSGTGNVVTARAEDDLDEIEEVNDNCILMANLQQASTSGTQHDRAPVYNTDGSAENDNHVTSVAPSMVHSEGTVETSSATNEEIRAHQETVYRNLVDQVAQVNRVSTNMRATNAKLKSELARYKIQEQRVEVSQEKYDKLEKCYQKSVYQEQCLTRKINALHLSSAKQIATLNDEISNLNKQLSKEKSSISSFMEEQKKLKHDFKIQEDKDQTIQTKHVLNHKPDSFYHPNQKMALGYPNPSYLKKAQQKQKSLYNGNLLLKEHDPPTVYDSEETLELAQESREKMRLLKKEIKPANYAKINHLSGVFVPQMTKSKEELFLSNVSNMVTVSKTISMPNEDLSDDTTPSVARKFLNVVESSLVTLQRVVKEKMALEVHNWSSSAHKEKNVSSNMDTASSTGLVHTPRTRRPQPKRNTRNVRVPSASKISEVKKSVTVEDHRRTLLLSKNQKTMSSECNNIKVAIQNDKSKSVCNTCKQCLVTANHDACLNPFVNVLNPCENKLCVNVPLSANQKRHRTQVWKPKQVGSKESLAPKHRLPRFSLKWSPSERSLDQKGKLVASKGTNCPNDDKPFTSN